MAKMTQQERIEQLTEQMNENIKVFQTDPKEEMELLKYLGRFNDYSIRNVSLIKGQYEGAYGVASYNQHKNNGHQVQKGEKAIRILAPRIQDVFYTEQNQMKFMSKATKEEQQKIDNKELKVEKNKLVGYLTVPVFDITQTNAKSDDYPNLYPNRPENYQFNGTEKELEQLEEALKNIVEKKEIKLESQNFNSVAKGFYTPSENKIVLKNSLTNTERPKVLIHELAHAEMHNTNSIKEKIQNGNDISTPVLEYQAEMTAYVISNEIGLDTKESSERYLANWTRKNPENNLDSDNYLQALSEVREVSDELATNIFSEYQSLSKDQNINNTLENSQNQSELNEFSMTIHYKDKNGRTQEQTINYPDDKSTITNLIYTEKATNFEIKELPKQINYLEGKVSNQQIDRFEGVANALEENKKFSQVLGTNPKENNMKLTEYIKEQYPNVNEKIAEKMNFLNDKEGINQFNKFKDTNLKATDIFIENKKDYQHNYVKLSDGNQSFNQKISTPLLTKKDLKQWKQGMNGNEWLNTDMNFKAQKNKPHIPIKKTNFTDDSKNIELKNISKEISENKEKIQSR